MRRATSGSTRSWLGIALLALLVSGAAPGCGRYGPPVRSVQPESAGAVQQAPSPTSPIQRIPSGGTFDVGEPADPADSADQPDPTAPAGGSGATP